MILPALLVTLVSLAIFAATLTLSGTQPPAGR